MMMKNNQDEGIFNAKNNKSNPGSNNNNTGVNLRKRDSKKGHINII
jgi:hypothetical protein